MPVLPRVTWSTAVRFVVCAVAVEMPARDNSAAPANAVEVRMKSRRVIERSFITFPFSLDNYAYYFAERNKISDVCLRRFKRIAPPGGHAPSRS